jgi:hypothetical protein
MIKSVKDREYRFFNPSCYIRNSSILTILDKKQSNSSMNKLAKMPIGRSKMG